MHPRPGKILTPIEGSARLDLRHAGAALLRAAQRARMIAAQTGTAVVVTRNGVLEHVYPLPGRSNEMNLPQAIYDHAKALPPELQREALDFIAWLEHRHALRSPEADTDAFLKRLAGSLGDDFPDDIADAGLASDLPREGLAS